ncbi:MAG: hypothetical protein NC325_04790 [Anaeroplasma bactoclasticum]|nr:hypothetical protein [Anaeroplasma bactoclasticum]
MDWSKIDKKGYLIGVVESPENREKIKSLIQGALVEDIQSYEIFMKGIDYSYYYEEID